MTVGRWVETGGLARLNTPKIAQQPAPRRGVFFSTQLGPTADLFRFA